MRARRAMAEPFVLSLRLEERGGPVAPAALFALKSDAGGQSFADLRARGALRPVSALPPGRCAFLIHGFNVSRSRGLAIGAAFARAAPHDALIVVLWPGDSALGPLAYPRTLPDALDAGRALARFLDNHILSQRPDIITHSFGVRVAFEAARLARRTAFLRAYLLAAAADEAALASDAQRVLRKRCESIVVISSPGDSVLEHAYPPGDWLEDLFHRAEKGRHRALGRHGPLLRAPDPRIRHLEIAASLNHGHGDYLPDPAWSAARRRVLSALAEGPLPSGIIQRPARTL